MPDRIDLDFKGLFTQWLAENGPAIEAFFYGLVLAVLTAIYDYLQSGVLFDWKVLAAVVIGAISKYLSTQLKHVTVKKAANKVAQAQQKAGE